jgi:hypothetical protein
MNLPHIQTLLDGIREEAKRQGVLFYIELDTFWMHPGPDRPLIHVCHMEREDHAPKGTGMRMLANVLNLADAYDAVVEIEHMTDEPRLGELYGAAGFEVCAPDDDGDGITGMRRWPRQAAQAA